MAIQNVSTKGAPETAIRLAGERDPAADLYNAYHYLTQLAGLYAHAGQVDHHSQATPFWDELADAALGDLGELFSAWQAAAGTDRGGHGRPTGVTPALHRAAITACQRAVVLIARLDMWTSMLRWTRILRTAERRWLRLLDHEVAARPLQAAKLKTLRVGAEARVARLTAKLEMYSVEQARITANFAKASGAAGSGGLD